MINSLNSEWKFRIEIVLDIVFEPVKVFSFQYFVAIQAIFGISQVLKVWKNILFQEAVVAQCFAFA